MQIRFFLIIFYFIDLNTIIDFFKNSIKLI